MKRTLNEWAELAAGYQKLRGYATPRPMTSKESPQDLGLFKIERLCSEVGEIIGNASDIGFDIMAGDKGDASSSTKRCVAGLEKIYNKVTSSDFDEQCSKYESITLEGWLNLKRFLMTLNVTEATDPDSYESTQGSHIAKAIMHLLDLARAYHIDLDKALFDAIDSGAKATFNNELVFWL